MASIRLPEEMENRLTAAAESMRRSKSFVLKEALERYLEDIEDERILLERISIPNPKFYTTEEVLKHIRNKHKKGRK